MKIKTAKVYTYTIYAAAVLAEQGGIAGSGGRLTLMSLRKARIKNESHVPEPGETTDIAARILRAAGFDHRITFDTGDAPLWLGTKQDHDDMHVNTQRMGSHVEVLSVGADVLASVERMPVEMLEHMIAASPGLAEIEDTDAVAVIDGTINAAKMLAAEDAKHGMLDSDVVSTLGTMASESDRMKSMLAQMETPAPGSFMEFAAAQGSEYAGVLDGASLRYVPTTVTDFANVYVPAPKLGQAVLAQQLRIAHIEPPTWNEPSEKMKASGVIGYWEFPHAAIGESVEGQPGTIGFAVVQNFKVMVRDQRAISPAGQIAVPLPVWERIAGDGVVPPSTMSLAEGDAFNRANAAPVTHVLAASPTAN